MLSSMSCLSHPSNRWSCCPPAVSLKPPPAAAVALLQPVELLSAIPVPPLSFSAGEAAEADELNELETKARNMSLHAHKLVKDNK